MADFCQQCSIDIFGEDFGDMKGLGDGKPLVSDHGYLALCEGCGPIIVDADGRCLSTDCAEKGHIRKGDVSHG